MTGRGRQSHGAWKFRMHKLGSGGFLALLVLGLFEFTNGTTTQNAGPPRSPRSPQSSVALTVRDAPVPHHAARCCHENNFVLSRRRPGDIGRKVRVLGCRELSIFTRGQILDQDPNIG
eukprot:gene22321-biopygen7191